MNVKAVLQQLGLQPSKRKGQNFLLDENIAARLAQFSEVGAEDAVLEVGPGLGMLTGRLLSTGCRLSLVELESKFCKYLEKRFPDLPPERIICADACSLDLGEIRKTLEADSLRVVSNVPYSISSDVVLWILKQHRHIKTASLLVQEEFAERIAADPGSKKYGAITVKREVFAEAVLGPQVPGTVFHPRANVSSRAITLRMREVPLVSEEMLPLFTKVVRSAFNQRRKTLLNSLGSVFSELSKPEWQEVLESCDVDPKRRAETLSLGEFLRVAEGVFAGQKKSGPDGPLGSI